MGSDAEWEAKGVFFKVVDEDMDKAILNHLQESFFPDEPIFRSLGINLDNSAILRSVYADALKDRSSIAAVDKDGRIMGVRVGDVVSRSMGWAPWIIEKFFGYLKPIMKMFNTPRWIAVFLRLGDQLTYVGPLEMLDRLNCDSIYDDKAVSSARWHGIKGLGSELVRRTEALAKERGCSHTYAMVTGNYSAIAFDRLGHTLVKAVPYAEFRDARGELYLGDTREHKECRLYVKAL